MVVYHVCFVCIKVVSYHYLSIMSMSVMSFENNISLDRGMGGWGQLYPVVIFLFGFF